MPDHRTPQPAHGAVARDADAPSTDPRGRDADSPWSVPARGWKEVLLRTWTEAGTDNIGLLAAGVAFYAFLALVPLLGAVVLTYGLLADPSTVASNMEALTDLLPAEVASLVGEQLMNLVTTSGSKKGLGVALALGIALFGARNAVGGIIQALNIAYEEEETRGFIQVNALALGLTAGAVLVFVSALFSVAAMGFLQVLLPEAVPGAVIVLKAIPYLLLTIGAALAASVLYRFGPSRRKPRWSWLTPGSGLFAVAWVILTLGFGIYVANFGNYGATYGSLSAVVVLLTWLYLSAYALLFGAEVNAELEHQTARDTTVGPARPMGRRKAWVADHVASGGDDAGKERDAAIAAGAARSGPNRLPAEPERQAEPDGDGRAARRQELHQGLDRLAAAGPSPQGG